MSPTTPVLRRALAEDLPFLFSLFRAIRGPEFAAVLAEPQLSALLEMQFHAQQTDYTRRFTGDGHSLILIDGQPAGRLWIHENSDEIHIPDISILPAYQRHGIGRHLYEKLMDQARQSGKPIRVTVFQNNDGSATFHEKLGFRPTGANGPYTAMQWQP